MWVPCRFRPPASGRTDRGRPAGPTQTPPSDDTRSFVSNSRGLLTDEPKGNTSTAEAYVAQFYRDGTIDDDPYDAVLESGADSAGPLVCGRWVGHPHDEDFDPSFLEDVVAEERFDQLLGGAEPTRVEVDAWRAAWIDRALGGDTLWRMVYVWRIAGESGRAMYCVSFHGDHGEHLASDGPFPTDAAARESLVRSGTFRE